MGGPEFDPLCKTNNFFHDMKRVPLRLTAATSKKGYIIFPTWTCGKREGASMEKVWRKLATYDMGVADAERSRNKLSKARTGGGGEPW